MKPAPLLKNIVILVLAPLLALGIFFLTRDMQGLTASVLDISEIKKIQTENWDAAYKRENQIFELFGSESLKKWEILTFELIYNPEKISLSVSQSSGFSFQILEEGTGSLKVQISDLMSRNINEGWFQVPFSGEKSQLLLAETNLQIGDKKIPLRVGSLDYDDEHSILP